MEQIKKLLRDAGALMTGARDAQVSKKGRSNYVTDTDVAVQEFLREALNARYPGYGFFSEEQENHPDFSRPVWILDPIDGTANFISRYRQSAISLALYERGTVALGAVYNPFTQELFSAERGGGAFLNDQPIQAERQAALEDVLVDLGTMPYYKDRAEEVGRLATAILLRASDLRRCGSAALALCHTADGRIGGMMEGSLNPWDYAAGMLIASEAGARVTDWEGNPLSCRNAASVLAAGNGLHPALLKLIREVLKK